MTAASPLLPIRLLLTCGLLLLSACTTTRTLPVAPIPLSDPVEFEMDGRTVVLHHPRLEEGELVGWERASRSDSTLVRVPYEQDYVMIDQRTSLIVGLGGLGLALLLVAAF
ncbi:MAG: hypothetical protein P8188_05900 [Gemmatimonadota bacterium]